MLKRRMTTMRYRSGGFTLMELMIAMAISLVVYGRLAYRWAVTGRGSTS